MTKKINLANDVETLVKPTHSLEELTSVLKKYVIDQAYN